MSARRLFLQVVLLAAMLAGCIDDSPQTDSADSERAAAETQDPEAPTQAGVPARPSRPPTTPQTWDVDEEGYLPAGSAVAGFAGFFLPGFDRWFPQQFNGTVLNATLTMTWDATSPATEHLLLGFGIMEIDDGREYAETYEFVSGPSPLSLDLRGLDWDAEDFVVWAWFEPFFVQGGTGQSFAIEGEVLGVAG